MLLLEGTQEGTAPKLWVRLYGGDKGWNIEPAAIIRMLELDDDADELWDFWDDILANGRYTNAQGTWRMVMGEDLTLELV